MKLEITALAPNLVYLLTKSFCRGGVKHISHFAEDIFNPLQLYDTYVHGAKLLLYNGCNSTSNL